MGDTAQTLLTAFAVAAFIGLLAGFIVSILEK